jgi:hypothetical protein
VGIASCVSCTADQYCGACSPNYGSPISGVCYLCGVQFCSQCNNNTAALACLACIGGYQLLSNGLCGPICNVTDCQTCLLPYVCDSCRNSFTLKNNTCVGNCGIDFCIVCQGTICTQCVDRYVLFNSKCVLLCSISNCVTCHPTLLGQCQTCATGFIISSDGTACLTCAVNNCKKCSASGFCS